MSKVNVSDITFALPVDINVSLAAGSGPKSGTNSEWVSVGKGNTTCTGTTTAFGLLRNHPYPAIVPQDK